MKTCPICGAELRVEAYNEVTFFVGPCGYSEAWHRGGAESDPQIEPCKALASVLHDGQDLPGLLLRRAAESWWNTTSSTCTRTGGRSSTYRERSRMRRDLVEHLFLFLVALLLIIGLAVIASHTAG